MTRAQVHVYAVEILCPKCEQAVLAPDGGEFWSVDEVELLTAVGGARTDLPLVRCPTCGINLNIRMPKDTK